MFGTIALTPKSVADYRLLVGDKAVDELYRMAEPLRGMRVLHLSITAFGTGVAETLSSLVPLMGDLGLACQWQVIRSGEEFLTMNRALYEALGGLHVPWSPGLERVWHQYSAMNADLFDEEYDFVVIHDPQPAGILASIMERYGRPRGRWLWHCHLDMTEAQPEAWHLLRQEADAYDAIVFDMEEHVREDLPALPRTAIPPAIDPLAPRHMEIPQDTQAAILRQYGIDPSRPMVCQVSPLDAWHDPLGLIDAFEVARLQVPGLQLVLVASPSREDPSFSPYFRQVAQRAERDPDIFLLSDLNAIGNVEINVFQRAAQVVVQKAIRKGFGLMAAEALWKGRPVVAAPVGGLPRQVKDGETGYLVGSAEECADRLSYLLLHPEEAHRLGHNGREHVRRHFLITRYLHDYLALLRRLSPSGNA